MPRTSNRNVARAFANQRPATSHNGNLYTDGRRIWSYGPHFTIARYTDTATGVVCLVTTRSYSQSTACHVSYVRTALATSGTFPRSRVLDVEDVEAESLGEHLANHADIVTRADHCADKATRARKPQHKERHLQNETQLREMAARYYDAFLSRAAKLRAGAQDPASVAQNFPPIGSRWMGR